MVKHGQIDAGQSSYGECFSKNMALKIPGET